MKLIPNRKRNHLAILGLMIGAIMISFSGVWVKLSHVSPTVSAFYRVFFGGIFLFMAALCRAELGWKGKKHLLLCAICSLFFTFDLYFYHYSIHYIGPGLGTILPNFQVFILAIIGVLFLNEKIHLSFVFVIPLAFLGLFMIVGFDWHHLGRSYKIGVLFGLAAAICYASFLLSLRKLQSEQIGVSIFYVLMLVSFITSIFLGCEIHRTHDTFLIPDLESFVYLVALGLFSQSIGWILITNALPLIRTILSGFILLLQPALAFVWDVLFFGRSTNLINWMGVFLCLIAIYFGTIRSSQAK